MENYVYISSISIFSPFFLFFDYDFIIYINFTHISASNTATDDVTKVGYAQNIYYQRIVL